MSEELPTIPPTWCWSNVDDLLLGIRSGKSFKCEERPPSPAEVGVVKVSAVTWGTYNEEESKTCNRPEMENESLFIQPGDFLFSRANTIDLVGACVIAGRVTKRVMLSDKILRFRVRAGWDRWLLWLLRSGHGRQEIQKLATGNQDSMRNIGQARIRQIRAPLPPLPEQHRIVEAIESYFTRLDDAVATLERVQANLKRYRASVLKAAVEGRLVPTEADLARVEGRDFEPTSVLLERILVERRRRWEAAGRRGKYKEPVAPDTEGLPELPEGWCWATVEQALENHDSARIPVRRKDRDKRKGPFPYYGASGVIDAIDGFTHEGSYLLVGEDGANLLARSKPVAFQAHGQFWVNNHAHVLLPFAGMPLGYFEAHINSIDLSPYVTGSAQPKLPQRAMNKIPLALPPAAEQARIVAEVERQSSVIDALEQIGGHNRARCSGLRQSILKWAFEGKLVDQDPDDEPAEALLERIKAERPTSKKTSPRGRRASS